jgi:hypothetical protein
MTTDQRQQLPYYIRYYIDSSISSAVPNLDLTMQPMSSRFIHMFQRPAAANEFTLHPRVPTPCYGVDPLTTVPLRAATVSMPALLLYVTTQETTVPPTNSTYQSVRLSMAQPQKSRVMFDLVNEPTIRCPTNPQRGDITRQPSSVHSTSPT